MRFIPVVALVLSVLCLPARACELCAVYSANDARGESSSGFLFTLSQQYISAHRLQLDGEEVTIDTPDYVDSSITHFVPGYNFSSRFGVSLNVPMVYRSFRRTDLRYTTFAPPVRFTEKDSLLDLGDLALIGRVTVFRKTEMEYGLTVNVLSGVKFPTGNADRLKDEVEQSRVFESLLPPGTPHDPLGHSISSVHQHNLSAGSGSFDGIFGVTVNANWRRWIFNAQFQYYLRTEGESSFRYGDEIMVSGGPGYFLLLHDKYTLSLQANAVYDTMARDELLGQRSDRTGQTAWYMGPQLSFTWGSRMSANAGIDLPLRIANHSFQSVPDYRLHGGVTWRF